MFKVNVFFLILIEFKYFSFYKTYSEDGFGREIRVC